MARSQSRPRPAAAPAPAPGFTPAEVAALMRAGVRLYEQWGLSDAQARVLLGDPSARTYARWKSGTPARLPSDTARRLSYLMGIHKALRYLFPDISTLGHLEYTVRLVATGRVHVKPTITHVLNGIESVPQAFEITANKGKYRAVNPAQVMFAP